MVAEELADRRVEIERSRESEVDVQTMKTKWKKRELVNIHFIAEYVEKHAHPNLSPEDATRKAAGIYRARIVTRSLKETLIRIAASELASNPGHERMQ